MGRRTCPTTGKVSFVRHQDAAKEVARLERMRGLAELPSSFYECEHCKRWHVASMGQKRATAIQRKKRRSMRLQQRRGAG